MFAIRTASTADTAEITRVINEAFSKAEIFFVEGDRTTPEEVAGLLEAGTFLLAEDDKGLQGCVYLALENDGAYLGLLSVLPGQQKRGLGSALMNAAENFCRDGGCKFMTIKIVNLRTELPEFYRKRGYRETGTSAFPVDIPTKLPCHFIDMSKPLS